MIRKATPAPPPAVTRAAELQSAIDITVASIDRILTTEGRDRRHADVLLDLRAALRPPTRDGAQ